MNKTRIISILLLALMLFSCKEPAPKKAAFLSIRISDAELMRALESKIENGTQTSISKNVVLTLDNGRKITLNDSQITAAKTQPEGCKIEVIEAVRTVSLTANAAITNATAITEWQGKQASFTTDIPLSAPAKNVEVVSGSNNETIYKVTFEPTPAFARLEVFGKIEPKANANGKKAFESIEVTEVTINNYRMTIDDAQPRYFTDHNTTFDGFASTPERKTEMMDAIDNGVKDAFKNGTKVAAYQLFPKKDSETDGNYDHVVLKLQVKYSQDAIKAGYPSDAQTRYVTIAKFKMAVDDDMKTTGLKAGTVYKLNLNGLNEHFKTKEDGTPDPENPDTPEPESKGKKFLQVVVKPYTWTEQNLSPQI